MYIDLHLETLYLLPLEGRGVGGWIADEAQRGENRLLLFCLHTAAAPKCNPMNDHHHDDDDDDDDDWVDDYDDSTCIICKIGM